MVLINLIVIISAVCCKFTTARVSDMYIRSSGDVGVLYNGVKVDISKVHSRVSVASFDNEADVVEIEVRNSSPDDFGLLASTTDGLIVTDDRWQCLSKQLKSDKGDAASPNYKPAEYLSAPRDLVLISEIQNISMNAKIIRPVTDAVDGKSGKRKKRRSNKELPADFNCKLVIKNFPDLKRALFDPMKYRVSRGKTKLRIVARGSIKVFQDGAWLGRTPDHTNTLMLPIETTQSINKITAQKKQFDNNNDKNNLNTSNSINNNNVKTEEEELKISENLLKFQLSPSSLAAAISTSTVADRVKRSAARQIAEAVNLRRQIRRHGSARCDYHCREVIKKRILQSLFGINVLEVEIDNEADVLAIHVDRSLMADREPLSKPLVRSGLWDTFFGLYVESEDGSITTLPSSVPHKPTAFFENVSQLNPSDVDSESNEDVDRIKENEYVVSKVKEGVVSDWKCTDELGATRGGAAEPWQTIHYNDKIWKDATLYKMERINRARPDNNDDGGHRSATAAVDNDDGVPNSFIWNGENPWSKQMYCRYLIPRKFLGKKKVAHTHKKNKKVVLKIDEPAKKIVKRSPAAETTSTSDSNLKRRVRNFGEKSSIEDLKRKNEQLKASLRKVSNSERVLTEETEEMFKLLGEVNGALTEIDNKNEYGGGFMYGYEYGGKDDEDEDLMKKLSDDKKEDKKGGGGGGGGPKTWNEEFMEELTEV